MTLTVHTARVSYDGADRLDITRKSAGPDGIAFAPSWAIVKPALMAMKRARSVMELAAIKSRLERATFATTAEVCGDVQGIRTIALVQMDDIWQLYSAAYLAEMRESYRTQRAAWDALLARSKITLCCYCTDPARCHRTLLAGILAKLGATVAGERGSR